MKADLTRDESSGANPISVIWGEQTISASHGYSDTIQDQAIIWRACTRVKFSQDDRRQPDLTGLQRPQKGRPAFRPTYGIEQCTRVRNLWPRHL
jgi:hypothetical protein